MGLSFLSVCDGNTLVFLDLQLSHEIGTIHAQNYNKTMAGNSYLHFKSCHHPRWVGNIHKSKYYRLKHNCTRDFDTHGQHFRQKFLDKGYPSTVVDEAFTFYTHNDAVVVRNAKTTLSAQLLRFTTNFHTQFRWIEHIFQKHWSILQEDPNLKAIIANQPLISYYCARNLKTQIAPSKIKPKSPTASSPLSFFNIKGMYQCRKALCLTCKHVTHGQKVFQSKGKCYTIPEFYTCSSEFVYCMSCPCSLFYVVLTICTFCTRFGEHKCFVEADSFPKHFLLHYN